MVAEPAGRLRLARLTALLPLIVALCAFSRAHARDADRDGLTDAEEQQLGTSPVNPDTDGDGLLDGWEVYGLVQDGLEEPLPAWGADPLRQDIFVEIDWMESSDGSVQGNAITAYQAAVDVVRAFRRSGTDIRIHVDLGSRVESLVPADVIEPDVDFSEFSQRPDERKILPYQEFFPARPSHGAVTNYLSLYDVYSGGYFFRPSRRNVFFYVVIAEQRQPSLEGANLPPDLRNQPYADAFDDDDASRDGLRDAGVRVGVVFKKPVADLSPALRRYHYSVSLLHELGHAFGLGHGGSLPGYRWDDTNYKPNYLSIMNYRYEFCGVDRIDELPVMDFSHGRFNVLLDEGNLFETAGMGPGVTEHVLECAGLERVPSSEYPDNIDWNRNGRIDFSPVVQDINANGRIDREIQKDHDDWGKLLRDGFDGIGRLAFRGRMPVGVPRQDVHCLPGDFNGDGITDLFLWSGDRLAFAVGTPEGVFRIDPEGRRSGNLSAWRIGPAASFLVGDFFALGRDGVFAHRTGEASVLELNGGVPRLKWYEDDVIAGLDDDDTDGWRLSSSDRFLHFRPTGAACSCLAVTDGAAIALLGAASETPDQLRTIWNSGPSLQELSRGNVLSLREGRDLPEGGTSLFAGGGGVLLELKVSLAQEPEEPDVYPLDRAGHVPGDESPGGHAGSGWPVSPDDEMYFIDLDGDGAQETILKNSTRLGIVRWKDALPTLVWLAEGTILDFWPLSAQDRLLHGQFIEGGGEEVVLSSGSSWLTLVWDDVAADPRIVGFNNDFVTDTLPGWKLRQGQSLFVGSFLPGTPDMMLVQDSSSLLVAQFAEGRFQPFLRVKERLGDWVFQRGDILEPYNLDGDGELELLARRGNLFGVLDFSPAPRGTFLAWVDPQTLSFESAPRFQRGDVNSDGEVDISDVVAILGGLFLGFRLPDCRDVLDGDDDGEVNVSDPVFLLAFLFNGGARPPLPGPYRPGIDPTPDDLVCPGP